VTRDDDLHGRGTEMKASATRANDEHRGASAEASADVVRAPCRRNVVGEVSRTVQEHRDGPERLSTYLY